jgi:hypothetical protein
VKGACGYSRVRRLDDNSKTSFCLMEQPFYLWKPKGGDFPVKRISYNKAYVGTCRIVFSSLLSLQLVSCLESLRREEGKTRVKGAQDLKYLV